MLWRFGSMLHLDRILVDYKKQLKNKKFDEEINLFSFDKNKIIDFLLKILN